MEIKELLEQVKANKDNKELQEGLQGLFEAKEVIKEVPAKLTDKVIEEYLKEHQNLSEKLYNNSSIKFLARKLGKTEDEIKSANVLGEDIVFKKEMLEQKNKLTDRMKEMAISAALGDKAELLAPHVKRENIKIDDNFKFTGIDEEVKTLQERFPSLFEAPKKPTLGGTGLPTGDAVIKNPWSKENWDMAKQAELYKENKDLATKYMKDWENNYKK